MKAILQSALVIGASGRLQRAVLGVDLVLLIGAPWVLRLLGHDAVRNHYALLDVFLIMPLALTLGLWATRFRAVSAARTVIFIPFARLRLLLGLVLLQMVLAACMVIHDALTQGAAPVFVDWGSLTGTFIGTLAVGALCVLWMFFFVGGAPWIQGGSVLLLFIGAAGLPYMLTRQVTARALVGMDAIHLFPLAAIVATSVFTVWYLRARRIAPPTADPAEPTWEMPRFEGLLGSRPSVITVYLLGQPSMLRACWISLASLIGIAVLAPAIVRAGPRKGFTSELALAAGFMMTIFSTAGLAYRFGSTIARRSRIAWIPGGRSRTELFETAERLSFKCLAFISAPTLAVAAAEWMILPHGAVDWRYELLIGSSFALCSLYIGLANVGREWVGLVADTGLTLVVLYVAPLMSKPPTPLDFLITTLLIPTAFGLRAIARWRWQRIDWLICKPDRLSSQALRPVD